MRLKSFTHFSRFRHALLSVLLALLSGAVPALALEPTTPLSGYNRQSWLMENGLPQNTVQTLLQTRDGFLWLGTEVGLVRFDGYNFTVFDRNSKPALPANDIRCLLESSDGSLWIGTSDGLARMKDGKVSIYTTAQGLPSSGIRNLLETSDGIIWAWTESGLVKFNGSHFISEEESPQSASFTAVLPYGDGGFWFEDPPRRGAYLKGKWNLVQYYAEFPKDGIIYLTDSAKFSVFASRSVVEVTRNSIFVTHTEDVISRLQTGKELPGSRNQAFFADREGALWIGTNSGLARYSNGKVDQFPLTDPLATASILSIFEDREGNLWVGTESGGLHILRDERFRTLGAREGLTSDSTTAVVEDAAGTLWVGTNGSGLNAFRPTGSKVAEAHPSHKNKSVARVGHPDLITSLLDEGAKIHSFTVRDGLLSDVILSLAAASNGDLWVGTPDGLNRIHGGRIDNYTSADGLPDDFIRSLLAEADGSLWIGTRRGLTHWTHPASGPNSPGGKMETLTQANGLGSDLVGAVERDTNGNLWVATLAGLSQIGKIGTDSLGKDSLGKTSIVNFTTANGLSSNVITALLPRANGSLLIGTQDHGWNQWDGMKFTPATGSGLGQTTIHAILDDHLGHLWFATGTGIARCDCGGISMSTTECTNWIDFGPADGLKSRTMATNSHPSAWRTRDGHLWFATPKGLVEVDPAHFPVNAVPPPVALERFAVDDVEVLRTPGAPLRIAAGHVHFQFDYAGLSFTAPQKVHYRYMLQGFDRGWTEAGTRRTAYYTNIPPGKYTFRVQAANNDGLWNSQGAALAFELRPRFYHTLWFYGLLLALVIALVAVGLRLRLRRAEGEFRAVLAERSRIAREIHDTLAQGYVGVSVQLEVLSELLRRNKTEAAAKHLDLTRGHVRQGLAEARQSIWALRSQDSAETTLPVKIRRVAEAEDGHGLAATFSSFGAYRPLPVEIEQEFLRVAQEAVHNVRKHAGATTLAVQLEYGPAEIALEVRDNGSGFDASELAAPTPGHYGLTGMRERAEAIGGRLEIGSEPGTGTTVRLVASARDFPREAKEQS